jgi:hypothetical protein
VGQRQLRQFGDELGQRVAAVANFCRAIGLVDQSVAENAVNQAGGVAQQVLDDHRPMLRLQRLDRLAVERVEFFHRHLQVGELGQILRHRGVEVELAVFDQRHRCDRDDRLGHRRQTKDCVVLHRDLVLAILVSDRLEVGDLVVARDQQHRARQFAAIDKFLVDIGQMLQPSGRKPKRFRIRMHRRRQILRRGDAHRPARKSQQQQDDR